MHVVNLAGHQATSRQHPGQSLILGVSLCTETFRAMGETQR